MTFRQSTFALTAALVLAGSVPTLAKTLEAVATFTVLADVVRNVGGDRVHVTSLVGPNGDPHEFEPTPNDAKTLKAADLVFVSGEGLEGWLTRLIKASGYSGTPIVASTGIKTRKMEDEGKMVTDPHVWNDPANVIVWIGNIEKALSAADPTGTSDFKANADSYRKELQDLDAYAKTAFKAVPAAKRKVLTSHDAFGYFGRAYGLNFIAPIGLSTESEASAKDMARLINQIKKEGVKVYFFENSNDPRLVRQIAAATGAQPGGELYVEALSPADGPAATYARMLKHNIDQIIGAVAKN